MRLPLLFISIILLATSCRKDPDPAPKPDPVVPQTSPDLVFQFEPVAGNVSIANKSDYYQNGVGDEFTITKFNFYISNLVLRTSAGDAYKVPDSYYLLTLMDGAGSFTIPAVAEGKYSAVEFLIGVDSLRNVSGAQTGALDPAHDMFWDWNTGYIFYKLEGAYKSLSGDAGDFAFHVGGFSAPQNCIRKVTLPLNEQTFAKGYEYRVNVKADAAAIFDKPENLSFDTYYQESPSPKMFVRQADNYADMFTVKEILPVKK